MSPQKIMGEWWPHLPYKILPHPAPRNPGIPVLPKAPVLRTDQITRKELEELREQFAELSKELADTKALVGRVAKSSVDYWDPFGRGCDQ
jgi:hypothetical protein